MDSCVRGKAAFKDFVPTDNLASLAVEELFGMVDDETLQVHFGAVLVVALYSQRLNAGLALGALLPLCLGALVTAYVYVFRWEHLYYFAQHILDEREGGVVAGTEHIVRNAPHFPNLVWAACTAILGICGKGCLHVPGKVNLGDYCYVALCCVGDNLAALLLCVEERTVVLPVILGSVASYDGLVALGSDGRQFGVLLYFNAPALVVGEVPVETVEVVERQHVDKALD